MICPREIGRDGIRISQDRNRKGCFFRITESMYAITKPTKITPIGRIELKGMGRVLGIFCGIIRKTAPASRKKPSQNVTPQKMIKRATLDVETPIAE